MSDPRRLSGENYSTNSTSVSCCFNNDEAQFWTRLREASELQSGGQVRTHGGKPASAGAMGRSSIQEEHDDGPE